MRILILTFGTRGDVQPYVALGRELVRSGHDVTLSTAEGFRELVTGHGVSFIPSCSALLEIVQESMPSMSGPRDLPRIINDLQEAMRVGLDEQAAAAEAADPELIIYHPKCLAGPPLAELHGIRAVLSLPLPFYTPTTAYPIPFIADWPLGGRANRLSYRFTRVSNLLYGRMINSFRRSLGMRPASWLADPLRDHSGAPTEVLYPYSRHVVPVPDDYPPTVHVTGYWFLPSDAGWQPEPSLLDFLDAGEPPIYVGFGSMGFGNGSSERADAVRYALESNRSRGIVATGWGGLAAGDSTDELHVVDHVPHDWLFPRVAAVVHHGGAGTTAAGLAAGRPTLITPFLGDQGFWGTQVQRLGVGPEPLPQKKIRADVLTGRISELITNAEYRRHAESLASKINSENGAAAAVRTIESLGPRRRDAASTSHEDG